MKTTIQEIDGKMIATLEGELDTAAAATVEQELQPLHAAADKPIVLDCKGLEYISSSGLRLLLALLKRAKAAGGSVTLSGVNDDILNVFKMTGFINLFNFE